MKTLALLLFILLLNSQIFTQSYKSRLYHPFSGTVVINVEGNALIEQFDYKGTGTDYSGKVSLEYYLPAYSASTFGFRLSGSGGFLSASDPRYNPSDIRVKISMIGGGVVFLFSPSKYLYPYLYAGVSHIWFDPRGPGDTPLPNNLAGVYKKNEFNYNGELGVRFKITEEFSLILNGGMQISPNDYLDDAAVGSSNDLFYSIGAGLSYSFFTETDSDGDGIMDSEDICMDTPKGIPVDKSGCPLDSDKDGIYDYLDECPGTPDEVSVDSKGCPSDSDKDGVPDYEDICPGTQQGVEVDELGCPYDRDADGVPDYMDKCPDTPYDVSVDKNGCPEDSDLDGIPDYLDQCPDTEAGAFVDKSGCPEIKEEPVREVVLSGSTNFAFNSAELLPAAFPELDKLVIYMKNNPLSRWRIEGHTDNVGSEAGNKKMSLMRAQSVMEYFISKGLTKERFEVIGLGETFPVADNDTEEGRAKNRRVVIVRIN
ncbi:MAG: OmpA family protein [Ignavibacteriaceae bacterium]